MTPPAPLAISLGDPAGVGPELIVVAWAQRNERNLAPFFCVGGHNILAAAAKGCQLSIELKRIGHPGEALDVFPDALPVLGDLDCAYSPGSPDLTSAQVALASLTEATWLAKSGYAAGLVTGPIAKSNLAKAGFTQPGQTEFVADACGVERDDAVMMLAGPSLRTVPLTIHEALSDVPSLLSADLIVRRARVVTQSLHRDFGLDRPRLAICGLNPHAGESGRFGDEEARIILPAIGRLSAEGIQVTGPHPADALFAPHERERYDVALAMYHDQALIPIKALDFDQGVNVTLGLPIVRTSPDHGTAFAIAGTGQASANPMITAIRMAGECAARRAKA